MLCYKYLTYMAVLAVVSMSSDRVRLFKQQISQLEDELERLRSKIDRRRHMSVSLKTLSQIKTSRYLIIILISHLYWIKNFTVLKGNLFFNYRVHVCSCKGSYIYDIHKKSRFLTPYPLSTLVCMRLAPHFLWTSTSHRHEIHITLLK